MTKFHYVPENIDEMRLYVIRLYDSRHKLQIMDYANKLRTYML